MDQVKAPPDIFNRDLLRVRRQRAARRGSSFLALRCAQDAIERLCDINRQFDNALLIGSPDFCEAVITGLPKGKKPKIITTGFDSAGDMGLDLNAPDEEMPGAAESYDLVVSSLSLHNVNDLPGALIAARRALKPDGLFIGAMFGAETLTELRQAAYAADDQIIGGMTPRILPFADYSQAAALLQRCGLALPVVDTDRLTVNYKDLDTLMSDLRDMGDMNCLRQRDPRMLGKAWRHALLDTYRQQSYEHERFIATFEILWMTGWSPHDSQQKPLKPGSAKMRLADALGTIEKPAN